MTTNRALIFGATGQDGSYLSQLLLSKGYEVFAATRSITHDWYIPPNHERLGLRGVKYLTGDPQDFRSVISCIDESKPTEIYNLAGQSSVSLSYKLPSQTFESISQATINLLEGIRLTDRSVKFYNASSSECFGQTDEPLNEMSRFSPRSPYAVAKAAAHWTVSLYRESFGLFACNGILFNHESPLRPKHFVTKKIVAGAVDAFRGSKEKTILGNLNVTRDWGYAPEYVDGMWRMLQATGPGDYVLCTGRSHLLRDFVALVYATLELNWENHVLENNEQFARPMDISVSLGDATKASQVLGWQPTIMLKDLVSILVQSELEEKKR